MRSNGDRTVSFDAQRGMSYEVILDDAADLGGARDVRTVTATVEVNQAGYVVGFPKYFVVQTDADLGPRGSFTIKSEKRVEYQGSLESNRTPTNWPDHYYRGTFTDFDKPGAYTITATFGRTDGVSHRFRVDTARNVYLPAFEKCLHWFTLHRCGDGVDHGHMAADRVIPNPFGKPFDARGGWHDAADMNVYMGYLEDFNHMVSSCVGEAAYLMLHCYEDNPTFFDAIDRNTNGVSDLIDESVWGLDWLVRMKPQDQTGGAFYQMKFDGFSYTAEGRKIANLFNGTKHFASMRGGAGMAIAAIAKASRLNVASSTYFKTADYRKAATEAWDWYIVNNAAACNDGRENFLDQIAWATAGVEMYRATGAKAYIEKAQVAVDAIIKSQSSDTLYTGWFDRGDGGAFWSATDEGNIVNALVEYAKAQPADANRIANIKATIRKYMDFKLNVTNKPDNPYGLVKIYFKHRHSDVRSEQFFMPRDETMRTSSNWYQGENAKILSNAWAGLLADEFLGGTNYRAYAIRQLDWVYGVNVLNKCFQKGIGANPDYYSHVEEGGIPNGCIGNGNGDGLPCYATDAHCGEQCIYHVYMAMTAISKVNKVAKAVIEEKSK